MRADASGQHVDEHQRPRRLPAAEVARRRAAPDVRGKSRAGLANVARHSADLVGFDATFLRGEFRGELGVDFFQRLNERLESTGRLRAFFAHELLPVDPAANEVTIEQVFLKQ